MSLLPKIIAAVTVFLLVAQGAWAAGGVVCRNFWQNPLAGLPMEYSFQPLSLKERINAKIEAWKAGDLFDPSTEVEIRERGIVPGDRAASTRLLLSSLENPPPRQVGLKIFSAGVSDGTFMGAGKNTQDIPASPTEYYAALKNLFGFIPNIFRNGTFEFDPEAPFSERRLELRAKSASHWKGKFDFAGKTVDSVKLFMNKETQDSVIIQIWFKGHGPKENSDLWSRVKSFLSPRQKAMIQFFKKPQRVESPQVGPPDLRWGNFVYSAQVPVTELTPFMFELDKVFTLTDRE